MAGDEIAAQMRQEAGALLRELDDGQRKLAALEFSDAARRWIEYRPHLRPGGCLALMSVAGRKAARRLLATGLSEHCFAQAMAIVALEEVLDLQEQRAMNRTAAATSWPCSAIRPRMMSGPGGSRVTTCP